MRLNGLQHFSLGLAHRENRGKITGGLLVPFAAGEPKGSLLAK